MQPNAIINSHAPDFTLTSVQDSEISLANYREERCVILWFSRGFQCQFCRGHMERITETYEEMVANEIEVIQVAPNLLESARVFFAQTPPQYPFVCDPDKRLYAVYGLGDRGALEATRNAVVSFSHAFTHGEGRKTVYGSWVDVMNRNFIRRLHHHALTAVEQGLFIINKEGLIRYQMQTGPLDPIPSGAQLLEIALAVK
jgi:peroxiredoxin